MAFSAMHITRCSGWFTPASTAAWNAASIAALPPMSLFMPTMPPPTLSDSPPVSYTMPLPTHATVWAPAVGAAGVWLSSTSAGSHSAHLPMW